MLYECIRRNMRALKHGVIGKRHGVRAVRMVENRLSIGIRATQKSKVCSTGFDPVMLRRAVGPRKSHDPVKANAIKIVSVGEDLVCVHQVEMMFLPEKPTSIDQVIFSPGTDIANSWTRDGRKYGGGPRFKGKYPEPLELGDYGGSASKGAEKLANHAGWEMNGGQLEVELKSEKIVYWRGNCVWRYSFAWKKE